MRSASRPLVVSCALVLAVVGLAAPANAATCTYVAATFSVVVDVGNGETATIARSGDAITLDGSPCDVATVTTTDTITVNATGVPAEITIDLSGGPFAPGATPEGDGSSEIEFTVSVPTGTPTLRIVGSSGNDNIVIGSDGINLNADEATGDVDVTIAGSPAIVVDGGDGDDVLSVGGGAGTGAPGPGATLLGGAGADLLLGGLGGSTFDGGAGTDEVDYAAATQLVLADLGAGRVDHQGGGIDTLVAIENLTGSPGDDHIVGDAGPNVLDGAGGDDTLDGGPGSDTASFRSASRAVKVDLGKGTAKGAGIDSLVNIENVIGSDFGNVIHGNELKNRLDGGAGPDEIYGHGGADFILGREGDDLLFGQRGNDVLRGGPGRDQLNGGAGNDLCKGGPDPDSYVFCENFPTVRLPAGVWFREAA